MLDLLEWGRAPIRRQAFEQLGMPRATLPPWAAGLLLTAGGWRGKRYRKD